MTNERTPLDDVDFLARSPHRVQVLERLANGSRTRRDLHDETGISQPTLGRVLGGFEDRGWVEREGQDYALTPVGSLVAGAFGDMLGTVETVHQFEAVAPYLPLEGVPFDLRALGDARITLPRTEDVLAHVHRGERVLDTTDRVRLVSPSIYPPMLQDLAGRLDALEHPHEAVLATSAVETARADPEMRRLARDVLRSEHVALYRYDDDVPYSVGAVGETALLIPTDEQGLPCALVESGDERVRSWVVETFEDYRDRATELSAADFPE